MRRQVCWDQELDDGITEEVRVSFEGRGKLKWQFKREDAERWEYDRVPTEEHWAELENRLERKYARGHVSYEALELVRRLRKTR